MVVCCICKITPGTLKIKDGNPKYKGKKVSRNQLQEIPTESEEEDTESTLFIRKPKRNQ